MNNLSLFLSGLVLIYIPACISILPKYECFSQILKPSYPCCKSDKVIYSDKDGDWGVENGKWCGIGYGVPTNLEDSCFSILLGYPCCKSNDVVFTDKSGNWGVENGKWCGIKDNNNTATEIDDPVPEPTEEPTEEPTKEPTEEPTKEPIEEPTEEPTKEPIEEPIEEPTEEPTKEPIEEPTKEPIEEPIEEPTEEPTKEPIEEPTKEPIEEPTEEPIEEPVEEPVQNGSDFDFTFLKLENNKKNMLYSPLSIKYALNMLQDGAEENTYDELNKLIGNNKLPKYPNLSENITLANGLFIRDIYYDLVKTDYIDSLRDDYDAEVIKDPFASAKNANKWVEDKTLGIIKNILSDEVVRNPDVGMLIINALAMDLTWSVTFNRANTNGQAFYKDDGQVMQVTMMSLIEVKSPNIAYYRNSDITVVTMNLKEYNDTQFEFMAIMPKENLSGYVENVTMEQINEIDKKRILTSGSLEGVNLKIPKFEFDYDLSLKRDLMNLGIKDAFDKSTANFSKMVDLNDRRIYVADALHKANIEFTEKGAKAAAATVIVMGGFGAVAGIKPQPINIVINKPFMFIIRDKNTKDIWFTGTVYEPNLWENDKSSYL